MIDWETLQGRWRSSELAAWAELLPAQVEAGLSERRYGDLPRWRAALAALPSINDVDLRSDADTVTLTSANPIDEAESAQLEESLKAMHPWRKGPFQFFDTLINTEWRSDWKWQRLAPHIRSLLGKRVLDVGCGNGYHCWRMRGAGAAEVIGIDPTPLFVVQFQAVQRYVQDSSVCVLPLGIEKLPAKLHAFDSVFSMGVLYHRRSPIDHLQELKDCLVSGGELILETLVIEGADTDCLVPGGRYARMGNVWFLPSSAMLLLWLRKLGWKNPRLVDENVTSVDEQRSTDWMRFHSLVNFLDPKDRSKTIEGYPAPRRAIFLAEAP
ncbi:MAG: tRNA 5-methoxyuridine(34)/uridine 5-oxyacetic acid(34) synthase CmoB [Pseudomonadota bacterium]